MTEKEQLGILQNWMQLHRAIIFKVVRSYAAADPDDLFQEIIIHVWRSIPAFRGESSVSTWLYRISLNTAITWTKKEKKHTGAISPADAEHLLLHENDLQRKEELAWIYKEIQLLDPIERSLTLLMLEGYSYKEMASIVGISESNVGVKINRIKKHLVIQAKKNQ